MLTDIRDHLYLFGFCRHDNKSEPCKQKSILQQSKRGLMKSWADQSKSFFDNLDDEVFAFQQKVDYESKKSKSFFETLDDEISACQQKANSEAKKPKSFFGAFEDEISAFQKKIHVEAKNVIRKTWLQVQRDLLLDETVKTTRFLLKNNGLGRRKNWLQYQRESLLDERLIVPTTQVSPPPSMVLPLTKKVKSETDSIQGLDISRRFSLDRRSSSDSRLYVRVNSKINGHKKESATVKRRKSVLNSFVAISKKINDSFADEVKYNTETTLKNEEWEQFDGPMSFEDHLSTSMLCY